MFSSHFKKPSLSENCIITSLNSLRSSFLNFVKNLNSLTKFCIVYMFVALDQFNFFPTYDFLYELQCNGAMFVAIG